MAFRWISTFFSYPYPFPWKLLTFSWCFSLWISSSYAKRIWPYSLSFVIISFSPFYFFSP